MPQRRQAQFRGRRGARLLQLLDIGGDMHALDGGDVRNAARLQPIEEFHSGAGIGAPRVRIADIGGEEFKKAIGRALADGGDEGGGAINDHQEEIRV
jgi:hypothetical protein